MDAPPSPPPDRPDPARLRPGQARRRLGRIGQQAPGVVPRLPAPGRRDVVRQLPRPAPRRPGPARFARPGRLLDRRPVDARQRPGSPAPPPASTLPPGLADHPDYEILRELGQGGMGVVYLAQNKLMGRKEVLKVVSSHLINRRGVLDRFLGEIRNAARLHHPNIVTAYSALRLGESLVLAMEYVEGLDLAKLVKASGPLPVANACNYVHQAALGLQHAHEHGMVHRDIKPSNLMLARQGNRAVIKVLDFGLAKVQSEGPADGGLTHEGQMLGTPDYIAPEQIGDARRADIRADIYSLGCTLYYLLTGGPPFQGDEPLRHPAGAPLDGRDAAEPGAAGGAGGAGGPGGQDDGQGAGAAVPGAEGGGPGADPVLQEGGCGLQESESGSVPGRSEPTRAGRCGAVSTPTQPATNDAGSIARPPKAAGPSSTRTEWKSLIDLEETGALPRQDAGRRTNAAAAVVMAGGRRRASCCSVLACRLGAGHPRSRPPRDDRADGSVPSDVCPGVDGDEGRRSPGRTAGSPRRSTAAPGDMA